VSGPVTAGNGVSLISPDMSSAGYVREEFFIEGEAANYQPVGALSPNGKWRVEETETAPFKTRMAVWKPADPADFNGTVFVEWLNVSPGFDNPPDWLNSHNHDVPVLLFQTEGDLFSLRYLPARQRDSKNIRLWEIAGTAHADAYLGGFALADVDDSTQVSLLDPAKASGGTLRCVEPINANAQYTVLNAALVGIERWVRDGTLPRRWPRIETTGSGADAAIVRDEHGIARGGIRTPIVEAPLATNDGEENQGSTFCRLFGHTKPFDAATVAELYPNGPGDYVEAFDKAVDKAVKAGIWLEPDAEKFKAAARQITFG
jgi:hypothetical protein